MTYDRTRSPADPNRIVWCNTLQDRLTRLTHPNFIVVSAFALQHSTEWECATTHQTCDEHLRACACKVHVGDVHIPYTELPRCILCCAKKPADDFMLEESAHSRHTDPCSSERFRAHEERQWTPLRCACLNPT